MKTHWYTHTPFFYHRPSPTTTTPSPTTTTPALALPDSVAMRLEMLDVSRAFAWAETVRATIEANVQASLRLRVRVVERVHVV